MMGATRKIDGAFAGSGSADGSSIESGLGLVKLRTFRLPAVIYIKFLPMLSIELLIEFCAPWPIASMAITAATPITIPNTVNAERSLFEDRPRRASSNWWRRFMMLPPIIHHAILQSVGSAMQSMDHV